MGQDREDSQGQEQRREWGQRIADVDKGLSRLTLADLFPHEDRCPQPAGKDVL